MADEKSSHSDASVKTSNRSNGHNPPTKSVLIAKQLVPHSECCQKLPRRYIRMVIGTNRSQNEYSPVKVLHVGNLLRLLQV
jgi:hypothetical protein